MYDELTKSDLQKMQEEIDYRVRELRPKLIEDVQTARAFGDLSENAEYDEAKNEQSRLEAEILELEEAIRTAEVVDGDNISTDTVNVGTTVRVKYIDEDGDEDEYTITGARESDPMNNKISNECPMGKALLGHGKGETVTVDAPDGLMRLEILEIKRDEN